MQDTIHILVVDDEPDAELMFKHSFRKEIRAKKINFHFSLSANAALTYLESASDRAEVTLILSDINMPGMNGLELLKGITETYPQLPVFMVTAYGDEQVKATAKSYGAKSFFNKPVDFKKLKEDIFNCVGAR